MAKLLLLSSSVKTNSHRGYWCSWIIALGLLVLTNVSVFGQSNTREINTQETTQVDATVAEPNIRVTKSGAIVTTGTAAIDLGDIDGRLTIEKGNDAATGLVQSDSVAITLDMQSGTNRSITNYGTISSVTAIENNTSLAGSSLSFINSGSMTGNYLGGSGADLVYLKNGSTTVGNINLGAGNNIFEIHRGVTLTGSITGDGNNLLTLYGNSTITGSLTASSSSSNTLFLDPVAGTKANVTGSVDFDGVITTTLQKTPGKSTYKASQLFAGGGMDLNNSTLTIGSLAGTGTLTTGDKFLVLSATGGVSNAPTTVNPTGLEMLTFGAGHDSNNVYIVVTGREDFADHVNENSRAIASEIDAMIDNHAIASGSVDRVFGELQLGTKADTRRFFAGSHPSQFLSLPVSGIQTTQQMTFGIADRLSVLRERMGRRATYVPNGYYGQSCDDCCSSPREHDVFVRAFGGYHKEDTTSDQLAYRSTSQGIQVGVDRRIGSRAFLGASFGYADISIRIPDTDNTANDLMMRFGGYYTRLFDNETFFDAEVTYGHHDNQLDRYYSIHNVGGRYVGSKYQAHDISSYIGLGRKFVGRDTFYISPLVSAQHIYYRQEAFSEQGAYGLYHFERQGLNSVNLRAAIRIGQERWGGKNLGYEFEAGYNVEVGDNICVKGGLIGGPSDMFTMSRPSATENGFYGAWKLSVRPSDHCQLFGRYLGEGSKGGFSHGAEFGGIWMF